MNTVKDLLFFIILLGLLFGVSYEAKNYLSSKEQSIVKEFINIPFAMMTSRLLFMNQKVAASQYYQFLAIVYSTRLQFPHYHTISAEEPGCSEQGCDEEHEHEHGIKTHGPHGEKYVAYSHHGPGGQNFYYTQEEFDVLKKREEYIIQHTSKFIDIDYFYDLIDLSNALDGDNDYLLMFGRGWSLNVEMSQRMINVLENSYKRTHRWRTIFDAGWIALYNLRDYEQARKYLQMASNHKDAPAFVSGIYTYSFYVDKKYEAAIYQIAQQITDTKDHNLKTRLQKKMKWYQALLFLNRAAKQYQKVNGEDIEKLIDLVDSGLIKEIPEDLIGKGFTWDEKNSEVISQNIFDLVKRKN